MTTQPAIETFHLSRRFGRRVAVDGLSLRVPRGGVFGLLGPAGAGKTTTVRMLLGLLRPSSGAAAVLGHDVERERGAVHARVGAALGAPAFYAYLSGRDNLRLLARWTRGAPACVGPALAAVGLAERAGDRLRSYSPGMRRRLGIAAALLGRRELLILDDPTGDLDDAEAAAIRELIRGLGSGGRTVFLAARPGAGLEQICDGLALIDRGRLVGQGPASSMLGAGLLVEAEPLPVLRAVVGRLGLTAHPAGPRALLLDLDPADTPRLASALSSAGVTIFNITPRRLTLEERFREPAP